MLGTCKEVIMPERQGTPMVTVFVYSYQWGRPEGNEEVSDESKEFECSQCAGKAALGNKQTRPRFTSMELFEVYACVYSVCVLCLCMVVTLSTLKDGAEVEEGTDWDALKHPRHTYHGTLGISTNWNTPSVDTTMLATHGQGLDYTQSRPPSH